MSSLWKHEFVTEKNFENRNKKNVQKIKSLTPDAEYDVCYISGNPGFLFNCLSKATNNVNKKYVIIFKEELPGGSWSITEESDQYAANHFFCSTNPGKILKFNKENKILTDMELIEIDNHKLLVQHSKYNDNYKFYEFIKPVTIWIKNLYTKIKNTANIEVLNCCEVIKITNKNGINTIQLINKNKKEQEICCDYIHLGHNTFIKQYELGNNLYNMKKKLYYNKHEFFLTNTSLDHDIIIDTGSTSLFLIVQNLSKYFDNIDNNLIVIRYRNYNQDISFDLIENYLNKITGKKVKILKRVNSITKPIVSHENIDLIKTKLLDFNIKLYIANTSLMDEIIFTHI